MTNYLHHAAVRKKFEIDSIEEEMRTSRAKMLLGHCEWSHFPLGTSGLNRLVRLSTQQHRRKELQKLGGFSRKTEANCRQWEELESYNFIRLKTLHTGKIWPPNDCKILFRRSDLHHIIITPCGYKMLWQFARDRACFPDGYNGESAAS